MRDSPAFLPVCEILETDLATHPGVPGRAGATGVSRICGRQDCSAPLKLTLTPCHLQALPVDARRVSVSRRTDQLLRVYEGFHRHKRASLMQAGQRGCVDDTEFFLVRQISEQRPILNEGERISAL